MLFSLIGDNDKICLQLLPLELPNGVIVRLVLRPSLIHLNIPILLNHPFSSKNVQNLFRNEIFHFFFIKSIQLLTCYLTIFDFFYFTHILKVTACCFSYLFHFLNCALIKCDGVNFEFFLKIFRYQCTGGIEICKVCVPFHLVSSILDLFHGVCIRSTEYDYLIQIYVFIITF